MESQTTEKSDVKTQATIANFVSFAIKSKNTIQDDFKWSTMMRVGTKATATQINHGKILKIHQKAENPSIQRQTCDTQPYRRQSLRQGWNTPPLVVWLAVACFPSYLIFTAAVFRSADIDTPSLGSVREKLWKEFAQAKRFNEELETDKLFVTYELKRKTPYNLTYSPYTKCNVGTKTNKFGRKPITRIPMNNRLLEILDLTTWITTNLKIVFVGDSVGMQFHEILEEAAGILPHQRTVLKEAWYGHERLVIAGPTRGGGMLSAIRLTGLWLQKNEGRPPPNAAGGGWSEDEVRMLKNHTFKRDVTVNKPTSSNRFRQGMSPSEAAAAAINYDAIIFRIPHGWLSLEEITREGIIESLALAHKYLGVTRAVILSLTFNNNVKTIDQLRQLRKTNDMIRHLVTSWRTSPEAIATGVKDVTVLDFGKFTDGLTEINSQLMGLDVKNETYVLERLGCSRYPPSVAMACAEPPSKSGACTCTRNMISIDGMHWCTESVGGRALGGMACMLDCLVKGDSRLRECERDCNDKFMEASSQSWLS